MKFKDDSPAGKPTLPQQRDALQKGLGRCRLWAEAGVLADEPLLDACLHDKVFDKQCEQTRGFWLWNLVETANAQYRFRDPLYYQLCELPDPKSAFQLCELGLRYAQCGADEFRTQLYSIVLHKPLKDDPYLAEDEILELDGERAFLFAARIRGERLKSIAWDWHDESFLDKAVELLGTERVLQLLQDSNDADLLRLYDRWPRKEERRKKPAASSRERYRQRMRSHSVEDVLEAARGRDRCHWFRGWGAYAEEAELEIVRSALLEEEDPHFICQLLRVFSNRAIPGFDSRLIRLCEHEDEETRRTAIRSLAMTSHEEIRTYALRQLEIDPAGDTIRLFAGNFERGDERRILNALCLPEDSCQLHWMLMDFLNVLESNEEADCFELALVIYGETPCSICRSGAVSLLDKQKVAPEWLVQEYRYDCDPVERIVSSLSESST